MAEAERSASQTLPPDVYRSAPNFETELHRVFRAGWVAVAHLSQLPSPGSYRCVDACGEALVVTRDRDGDVHVLSRICTHRWMEICSGMGAAPSLQCPYHHWTFDLTGRLKAAPAAGGFDRDGCSLPEFRHTVWQGLVLVNVDGGAPPPEELWHPLSVHLGPYDLARWRVVSTTDWGTRPWDWKVLMDNGECYHHLGIHRDSLEPLYPARLVSDLSDNGQCTCLAAGASGLGADSGCGPLDWLADAAVTFAPGLTTKTAAWAFDKAPRGLRRQLTAIGSRAGGSSGGRDRAPLLLAYPFPNYALAVLPDVTFWYEAHPVAAGVTRLLIHQLLPPHLAQPPRLRARVARNDASLRVVHVEDERICSAVQRGLSTMSSTPGVLTARDRHNATFARWYRRAMADPATAAGHGGDPDADAVIAH